MNNINVIIGGVGGIGMGIARNISEDEIVLITGMNDEELDKSRKELEELGKKVETAICDITSDESLKKLTEKVKSLGKLKSVINCAGVSGDTANAPLVFKVDLIGTEKIINNFEDILEDNSVGIMIASMMGSVVPEDADLNKILENPSEEGNLEKLVDIVKDDSNTAYNYAKKGVRLLVKKAAEAWGKKNARIISISPGIILTPMAEEAMKKHPEQMKYLEEITPLNRMGEPKDISNVVELLLSDKASFITGSDILVDGGLANNLSKMNS